MKKSNPLKYLRDREIKPNTPRIKRRTKITDLPDKLIHRIAGNNEDRVNMLFHAIHRGEKDELNSGYYNGYGL